MLLENLIKLIESLENNIKGNLQVVTRIFLLRQVLYSHPLFSIEDVDEDWDSFLATELSARTISRLNREVLSYEFFKDELIRQTNFLVKKEVNLKHRKIKSINNPEDNEEVTTLFIPPSSSIALLAQDFSDQSPNISYNFTLHTSKPEAMKVFRIDLLEFKRPGGA